MRFLLLAALCLFAPLSVAQGQKLILASTTSTQNSGLYDYLLPVFTADTGIAVHVVAVGTGQALRIARNGDADALIVHHRPSEELFISEGYGLNRRDVMVNDFVIVGPKGDSAGVATAKSAGDALLRLRKNNALFISRGDESGTYFKELEIWQSAGVTPKGPWYREIGAGMGAALNMAVAVEGYVLTDRGTWLSFNNKNNLVLLFEGDPVLFNPYSIITVNPAKHPHVQADLAGVLTDWITSERGQSLIAAFAIDGQQLFCPSANGAKCAVMP